MNASGRLRAAAIATCATQGLLCGAVGSWQMWGYSIPDALAALLQSVIALGILIAAVGYFLAAFLLARRWLPWRIAGGVLDGGLTVFVAYFMIWLGQSQMLYAEYAPAHDPNAWPPAIAFAIAAVWIVAFAPVVAMPMTSAVRSLGADRHEAAAEEVGD